MNRHLLALLWRRRRASGLLVLEIVLALLMLFGVSLIGLGLAARVLDPCGYAVADVYLVHVDVRDEALKERAARHGARLSGLAEEIRALPETVAVAGCLGGPYEMSKLGLTLDGPSGPLKAGLSVLTDEGDKALAIELEQGRWFEPGDEALDWTPAVVNRRLADELTGAGSVLGRTLDEDGRLRVVGVVAEFRQGGELASSLPHVLARASFTRPGGHFPQRLLVRARPGAGDAYEEHLMRLLLARAPDWSFFVEPLAEVRRGELRAGLLPFLLAALLTAALMVMVVLGMIAVFTESVARRRHEIGLRRALGGGRTALVRQLIAEALLLTAVGALAAAGLLLQLPLLGVAPTAGWGRAAAAWGLATGLMLALSVLASLQAALAASRIEPARALHYE